MDKLVAICILTALIHMIDTLSYSVRIAGVRTSRLALSISLFNTISLISRTANMVQAPLAGSIIDTARKTHDIAAVQYQFRWIIGSASIGTLIAIFLIPSFVYLFSRVIQHFEKANSISAMLKTVMHTEYLIKATHYIQPPQRWMWQRFRVGGVSKRITLFNALITGIYTVGVLSCLYASLLSPNRSSAISLSSGLVNGAAALLLALFIDPKVALLTDSVLHGEKPKHAVNKMVGVLVASKLLGTVIAQVLLLPASLWIQWITKFL